MFPLGRMGTNNSYLGRCRDRFPTILKPFYSFLRSVNLDLFYPTFVQMPWSQEAEENEKHMRKIPSWRSSRQSNRVDDTFPACRTPDAEEGLTRSMILPLQKTTFTRSRDNSPRLWYIQRSQECLPNSLEKIGHILEESGGFWWLFVKTFRNSETLELIQY